MMPCRPAMTFWSIVGHARRQTAGPMGPSMRLRSNLAAFGLGPTWVTAQLYPDSDVQFLSFFRALHDEPESRRRVLAHQLVDHPVGDDLIGDLDAEQPAGARVERGLPQDLGHHLAKALEARDLRAAAAVAMQLQ